MIYLYQKGEKTMMKKLQLLIIGIALLVPSWVQAEMKLVGTRFDEIYVQGDGKKERNPINSLSEATAGQEVIYILTYKNEGKTAVKDVLMTDPIPKELEFISASISTLKGLSADLSVSVNGGKAYGELSHLTVLVTGGEPRAAEQKDVTHVRWLVKSAIVQDEEIFISFRTRMK